MSSELAVHDGGKRGVFMRELFYVDFQCFLDCEDLDDVTAML